MDVTDSAADAVASESRSPAHPAGDSEAGADAADLIMGTVVDRMTTRPLAGLTVVIGGARASTGPDGRFTLGVPSMPYDAVVVDPNGWSVSVVLGLSRLDPTLVHSPSGWTDPSAVAGRVNPIPSLSASSSPPGPATLGRVYAFSNAADNWVALDVAADGGLTSGPIALSWPGGSASTGDLVGVLLDRSKADAGSSWAAGQAKFELLGGPSVDVPLALSDVASVTVSGQIALPRGYFLIGLSVTYRWPIVHAFVSVVSDPMPSPTFAYMIPDLKSMGGVPCVEASAAPGTSTTRVCGAPFAGSSTLLQVQAAPAFVPAIARTSIRPSDSWSWTTYDNGVYGIQLKSNMPGPGAPDIQIFTSGTKIDWHQLQQLGVPFTPGSGYAVTLAGFGPYSSIDEACGPYGIGDAFPQERRWSYADTTTVKLTQ